MDNIIELHTVRQAAPIPVNGKVPPRRMKNAELRSQEYLTQNEVGHSERSEMQLR